MNWLGRTLANVLGIEAVDTITRYANDVLTGKAEYNRYSTDDQKLQAIFTNPAMLKVFCLQCDLFSLGQLYVYKDGKEVENDPYIEMMKKPNPFQFQSQFLWDMMFWNMVGNVYNYCDSKIVNEDNILYVLENHKIEFPESIKSNKDKLLLSKSSVINLQNQSINYKYSDGSMTYLPWGNILHTPDLSNGTGNWFQGGSRIDSLYKIISNSEAAMDAQKINLDYSSKFFVSGEADPNNTTQLPMSEIEKQDIETKMNSRKRVYASKNKIDIKRFVSDMAALKLEDSQLNAYFQIGSVYQIPKDVLEMYNSGTYENQEKARGAFVSYCLQPKGKLFFESHANFFGYDKQGKSIIIDWEHLPFMQVFAKERAETDKIKSDTLLNLIDAGVVLEEINEMLDMKLTNVDYAKVRQGRTQNNISQNGQSQA